MGKNTKETHTHTKKKKRMKKIPENVFQNTAMGLSMASRFLLLASCQHVALPHLILFFFVWKNKYINVYPCKKLSLLPAYLFIYLLFW